MGGRTTRYENVPIEARAQVDAYKARSVWGRWWALDGDLRARLFTQDEIRWIRRYGARLDALACLAKEPANDRERHFVAVCRGDASPTSDRERLWLRVRVVCHYAASLGRAARCDLAEHRAAVLEQENESLRRDHRELEDFCAELIWEVRMLNGDPETIRRRSIANVEYATLRFRRGDDGAPPRHYRIIRDDDSPRWVSWLIPPMRSAIDQSPRQELIEVFAYQTPAGPRP